MAKQPSSFLYTDEPEDQESSVGRAMRVAGALAAKRSSDFAKPGRLVEVRFVKGQSLSLTASRLLALMILTAGGDAWREMPHRMRKADIRRGHKGNERITDMLEELHRTLFAEDDLSWRGRKATRRFPLIQMSKEEVDDENGAEMGWIEWEFTPDARRLIQESETYAVLNRQAVLGFRSSYALKLYELGALRIHRRQPVWRCDMSALRASLGISPDVYKDFAQLRRKVLQVAKAEIDQLAHFKVEWKEVRQGRTVVELEFRFETKHAPAQIAAVDEQSRHSVGRRARRVEAVEHVVKEEGQPALPEEAAPSAVEAILTRAALQLTSARQTTQDGAIAFPSGSLRLSGGEGFLATGRTYGGGWDVDLIAQAYREHMQDRLGKLTGTKLQRSWQGFCESYVARRGRPD